jgi:hypothetical protein
MTSLDEQNRAVRESIVLQIKLCLEDEFGKPPAHPMAVRRFANTLAKQIAGDYWSSIASDAIRVWELG